MTILQDKDMSVEIEGEIIEPAFLTQITLPAHGAENANLNPDFLAHKITRFQADLRSHTQRIFHYIEMKNDKALYSALVDLFWVLGNKGLSLRKRILINAHTLLKDQEFDSLNKSLSLGLQSESQIPIAQKTLLTKAKAHPFIKKVELNTARFSNAIDEARSYVEYGQLDEAIAVLKEAILLNPRQLVLHNDLLEIFQKTAEKESFISFYELLLSNKISLPPLWKKVALELGYENAL